MRFDVQSHNIKNMSLDQAMTAYKSAKSLPYRLKLRSHLERARDQMERTIDAGKHSRAVMLCSMSREGLIRMEKDVRRIRKTLH